MATMSALPRSYPYEEDNEPTQVVVMMMPHDFDDETPTPVIPRETMLEAREHSSPAPMWGNYPGAYGEGFTPSGPDRPTREIAAPRRDVSDGVPVAVDEQATARTLPTRGT